MSPAPTMLANPTISVSVDGSPLTTELNRIHEATVEQSLHLPDMFVLRLLDVGGEEDSPPLAPYTMLDADVFPIGGEVEISMGYAENMQHPVSVMKGEITAIELDCPDGGMPILTIRGYARSHRLHRGRASVSYQNVSDSDLVTTIGGQVGLTVEADATSTVHDHVFQHNQTNWEFLKERAALLGYELFVDDRTLHFRKPEPNQNVLRELSLEKDLISLRVSLSTAYQVSSVVVRSWDPIAKQAIVGTAESSDLAPETDIGSGSDAAATFGDAKVYVVNRPVGEQQEADDLAQAIYDQLNGTFIQAEGVCWGDPDIKPGVTLTINTVGDRLKGNYYVTSATHSLVADGYRTSFSVSGRQTNSLLELVDSRSDESTLTGVVVGIVTDNTDEDGHGRVKVKFPWLADNDQTWWAWIATPMAGSDYGFFSLPEVDDEVLVAFEHGDINRPYIVGALWNGQQNPPKTNSDVIGNSKVNQRIIKSRSGHIVTFDDTDGEEKITIIDKTGNNKITIDSKENTITIAADADVKIDAQGGVAVTAQKDVTVTAQGNAKVTASQNVEVNATADAKVTATGNAEVNATGNATVTATAQLNLKGSIVNLESQGMMTIKADGILSIQGSLVNIN